MTARPQSLLQIANARLDPSPLDRSVLVLVDAQLEYVGGRLPLAGIDQAISEAERLLALARRQAMPVLHVVQHSPPSRGLFDRTGPLVAVIPPLAPREGEPTVIKTLPNAFAGTDLRDRIQATGRSEMILAGFMTHMCISATARAALDHGIRTTVVAAATATRDIPDPLTGETIPAAVVHRTALAELADRFAIVVADAGALTASAAAAA